MDSILSYVSSHHDSFIDQLSHLLTIPSVSTDPSHQADIQHCAQTVSEMFLEMGLSSSVIQTKGHPVVLSKSAYDSSKKTILIYGHYDVQPEDPVELWTSPPFEPEIRDGYLYARGASDNKGQFMAHVAAVQSILRAGHELPCNVIFLIEGEEEIGSTHLYPFLDEYKDELQADVCLISDTPMYGKGYPSICFSLRGLLYFELCVTGPNRDLHSGQHGGVVVNPIQACATLLSSLKDENDHVLIPEFYRDVRPLTEKEFALIDSLPVDEDAYKKELAVSHLAGDKTLSMNMKKWFYPTLDCNGIWGGYIGEGAKTVIPSKANMKISMRLVSDQDPTHISQAFKAHVKKHCPEGVTVEIHDHSAAPAFLSNTETHGIKMAMRALKDTFNTPVYLQGEGGSIPILTKIQGSLGIDVVLMGLNFSDDNIHSPNERFYIDNFIKGIEASVRFLFYFSEK